MATVNTDSKELAQLRARVAELEDLLAESTDSSTTAKPTRSGEVLGVDQFRAVFDNFSGGMVFSRDGIIIDANAGMARLLLSSIDEIINRPIIDYIIEEDRQLVREHIDFEITTPYEHSLRRKDGTTLPVEVTASLVPSEGTPLRFSVIRDISERKHAQEDLECQRLLLQAILDCMPAGVFVVHCPSGRPVLVNQFSRKLLQKPDIRVVQPDKISEEYSAYIAGTDELYPTERLPIVRAMSGETSFVDDIELKFDDGTRTLIQVNGAPIFDASGEITMSVAITQDITDRRSAEEKVQSEQEFLRMLIRAHERDRQLMSYEIHDGLVQYITATVWHLDSVVDNAELDAQSKATLVRSQQLLRKSIVEARRVLSGLRPPVLDEQGIVVAIDYLVAENSEPGKLEIEIEHEVQFSRLEPLLEGAIFRIVQESLNNIRKHSGALRHVFVWLNPKIAYSCQWKTTGVDSRRSKCRAIDLACKVSVSARNYWGEMFVSRAKSAKALNCRLTCR